MLDIPLRRWKDRLIDPLARTLVPPSVTPAHITLAAFVCGVLACYFAATATNSSSNSTSAAALSFWLANRFLDCLDGSLARARNSATDLGGFLDLLSDFIIYSLLPIAICLGQSQCQRRQQPPPITIPSTSSSVNWTALALLEASFHVNNFVLFYSAAVAAKRHDHDELTSVNMRSALIEGFESGLLFTAMLIWPQHINFWMWAMSFGVAVGIGQRVLAVTSILSQIDSSNRKAR